MFLVQYWWPAKVARVAIRARGRSAGRFIESCERVARASTVDAAELVAAGTLAAAVWFATVVVSTVLAILMAVLVGGRSATFGVPGWVYSDAADVFFAILCLALGMVIMVNSRLRAAGRVASGRRRASAAVPKRWDILAVLLLAALFGLLALGARSG